MNLYESIKNNLEGVIKLTKDTRDFVEVGDILEDNSNKYVVTNVIDNPRSKAITVRDANDWRPIYATPISEWYGTKIVKGPFVREGGKITKKSLSESHSEDYCTVAAAEFVGDLLPADWKSLSEDELKDLVYDGVLKYNNGNVEPEYEDSDFYGDSADPDKVYEYIVNNF